MGEGLADRRADGFRPPIFNDLGAQRVLDQADCFLLGILAAWLALDPDQDIVRLPELLQRDVAETEISQRRTHVAQIRRSVGFHLQQDTAQEVDAEIETLGSEQPK